MSDIIDHPARKQCKGGGTKSQVTQKLVLAILTKDGQLHLPMYETIRVLMDQDGAEIVRKVVNKLADRQTETASNVVPFPGGEPA